MAAFNNTGPTNGSNETECDLRDDFKHVLLPVSYSLVFVFGLGLNITAMYFIFFRTKQWKPNTIFIINLSICDTLYILTLPFLIYYYADESDWPFGDLMCKLVRFLFYTNLYGSILFLSCISVHRFIGVCHPVRSLSLLNTQYARLVSVGIWVIILILQAPILFFSRTTQKEDIVCHDTTRENLYDDFMVYSSVVMFLLFGLPFVVVLYCNAMMVKKLLEPRAGGGPTSQRSKQKSVKMIILVLLTFILCFLPFHVNRIIHYTLRYMDKSCDQLRLSNLTYQATRPLLCINSCIDPILYFMAGQSFRNNSTRSNPSSERSISTL
ncbi:P2Y purinoceptor 2 [Danio aesculapii]|uniref:P2Y purinoceptor 2 n=1 Tax=Danio aesculapii TaxID=1142201 RepID=UPI0024C0388F|nr:P2Y purinoceptor 2 [Danio aesculapii]